jgi:hypothetical protein
VLSTTLGLTFFLIFVLMVSQVAAHLAATTRLRADVDHAVRTVAAARARRDPAALAAARQQVDAELVRTFGTGHLQTRWSETAEQVRLEVSVDSPARVIGAAADVLGVSRLHAVASVRLEVNR